MNTKEIALDYKELLKKYIDHLLNHFEGPFLPYNEEPYNFTKEEIIKLQELYKEIQNES